MIISIVLLLFCQLSAQEEQCEIIIISKRVGKEIDQEESNKFKLFEGINGFQSAVYLKMSYGRYFLKITYQDKDTGELKIKRIQQSEAIIKNRGNYIDRFEELQARKEEEERAGEIQVPQDTVYQASGTAFYIELLGRGFYSLNVDFRRNKLEAMSLGIQRIGDAFIPSFMYYHFRGKTYRTEIGCGISGIFDDGFLAVMIHGVYGYRYQIKNGALFRIGFTPFIGIPLTSEGRFAIMPLVGISFGYSL